MAATLITAYVTHELEKQSHSANSAFVREFNTATHQIVQGLGGVSQYVLNKTKEKKESKPPYNGQELGSDPEKCPGKGFKWKGKGSPSSGKGSWYNEKNPD